VVAVRDIIQYAEPAEFILVAARPGEGKCLGKGTKVVMHDGTMKPVEEIRIGDMLLGPDSLPRRVLSTTQGKT
jgi:replicative DNA helicase